MKDLKKLILSSLLKQKIASISKGAYINKILSKEIKKKINFNIEIVGYVKYNIYYIKIKNASLSNVLFLHKKIFLDCININLDKMNFDKITDIRTI